MTGPRDDEQARRDARWARHQAESQRAVLKAQLALGVLWVVIAVLWWTVVDGSLVSRWLYTGLAAVYCVGAVFWIRALRRPLPRRPEEPGAPEG